MVLTITFNPCIDKVYHCSALSLTGVFRASRCETFPAGKGINVARGVRSLGGEALALGFAGGHLGRLLRELLRREGLPESFTETQAEVRLNPTVRDPQLENDLHVVEPDQPVTAQEQDAFLETFRERLTDATAVVFAGSCRPGIPPGLVQRVVREANEAGTASFVDSRGAPLRAAVAARPFLMKPNAQELADLLGRDALTEEELLAGASEVVKQGAGNVVLSLGEQGAILACPDGIWRARPPDVKAANTVGCGDAMVAGLVTAHLDGASPPDLLRHGVAAGTVNVSLDSPGLVPRRKLEQMLPGVEIERLE